MITFKKNPQGALVTAKRIGTFTVSFYQDPDHGQYDILITNQTSLHDKEQLHHGQTWDIKDLNEAFQNPIGYALKNQQP